MKDRNEKLLEEMANLADNVMDAGLADKIRKKSNSSGVSKALGIFSIGHASDIILPKFFSRYEKSIGLRVSEHILSFKTPRVRQYIGEKVGEVISGDSDAMHLDDILQLEDSKEFGTYLEQFKDTENTPELGLDTFNKINILSYNTSNAFYTLLSKVFPDNGNFSEKHLIDLCNASFNRKYTSDEAEKIFLDSVDIISHMENGSSFDFFINTIKNGDLHAVKFAKEMFDSFPNKTEGLRRYLPLIEQNSDNLPELENRIAERLLNKESKYEFLLKEEFDQKNHKNSVSNFIKRMDLVERLDNANLPDEFIDALEREGSEVHESYGKGRGAMINIVFEDEITRSFNRLKEINAPSHTYEALSNAIRTGDKELAIKMGRVMTNIGLNLNKSVSHNEGLRFIHYSTNEIGERTYDALDALSTPYAKDFFETFRDDKYKSLTSFIIESIKQNPDMVEGITFSLTKNYNTLSNMSEYEINCSVMEFESLSQINGFGRRSLPYIKFQSDINRGLKNISG